MFSWRLKKKNSIVRTKMATQLPAELDEPMSSKDQSRVSRSNNVFMEIEDTNCSIDRTKMATQLRAKLDERMKSEDQSRVSSANAPAGRHILLELGSSHSWTSDSVTAVRSPCSDAQRKAKRTSMQPFSSSTSVFSCAEEALASSWFNCCLIRAKARDLDGIVLGPSALVKILGWIKRWLGLSSRVSTLPGRATNASSLLAPNTESRVGHAAGAVSLPQAVTRPWSMGGTASAGLLKVLNGEELKLPWINPRIVAPPKCKCMVVANPWWRIFMVPSEPGAKRKFPPPLLATVVRRAPALLLCVFEISTSSPSSREQRAWMVPLSP
jgi:hypothetical protein